MLLGALLVSVHEATAAPRIGFLSLPRATGGECKPTAFEEQFFEGLRELGYVVGQSIVVDFRCYGTDDERARVLTGFVRAPVDVIVVVPPASALAARRATASIPIVCGSCGDPVENGIAASLARPGGNVTGLASLSAELLGKRVQILKDVLPHLSRVAVVTFPKNPGTRPTLTALATIRRAVQLEFERTDVRDAGDFAKAFRAASKARAGAVLIQDDPLVRLAHAEIARLAREQRLPGIAGLTEVADSGLLMAYAPDRLALLRRAATFVDRIVRGAKPGELPFEQAAKYEFVVNMRTAGELGLAIPPAVLLRADRVIR
jgi:putative ABC transport system substrate-binding protein